MPVVTYQNWPESADACCHLPELAWVGRRL